MPLKSGTLTHTERAFIKSYSAPVTPQDAAVAAGLHPRSGYQMLARPEIQGEIRRQQLERLEREGLPLATSTLLNCMRSATAGWPSRIRAAEVVYDRTKPEDSSHGKEEHEMTAGELDERIAHLEALKVRQAKPVEATIVEPETSVFE